MSVMAPSRTALFAHWGASDRRGFVTPVSTSRACTLQVTRVEVLSAMEPAPAKDRFKAAESGGVVLALRLDGERAHLRSPQIRLDENRLADAALDVTFAFEYEHRHKLGSIVVFSLQRPKRYKARPRKGYKSLCRGYLQLNDLVQCPLTAGFSLLLYARDSDGGAPLARVTLATGTSVASSAGFTAGYDAGGETQLESDSSLSEGELEGELELGTTTAATAAAGSGGAMHPTTHLGSKELVVVGGEGEEEGSEGTSATGGRDGDDTGTGAGGTGEKKHAANKRKLRHRLAGLVSRNNAAVAGRRLSRLIRRAARSGHQTSTAAGAAAAIRLDLALDLQEDEVDILEALRLGSDRISFYSSGDSSSESSDAEASGIIPAFATAALERPRLRQFFSSPTAQEALAGTEHGDGGGGGDGGGSFICGGPSSHSSEGENNAHDTVTTAVQPLPLSKPRQTTLQSHETPPQPQTQPLQPLPTPQPQAQPQPQQSFAASAASAGPQGVNEAIALTAPAAVTAATGFFAAAAMPGAVTGGESGGLEGSDASVSTHEPGAATLDNSAAVVPSAAAVTTISPRMRKKGLRARTRSGSMKDVLLGLLPSPGKSKKNTESYDGPGGDHGGPI